MAYNCYKCVIKVYSAAPLGLRPRGRRPRPLKGPLAPASQGASGPGLSRGPQMGLGSIVGRPVMDALLAIFRCCSL